MRRVDEDFFTDSLDEYQDIALQSLGGTRNDKETMTLAVFGLTGESGEVSEHVKKYLFHGKELDIGKIKIELADVLWYLALMADCCGLSMSEIATTGILKVKERYPERFKDA